MREVWAVVSDLHCGSTLGLCHEDGVLLDDGGQYIPSAAQRKLWECWRAYWEDVELAVGSDDRLIVVLNGDILDGDHHKTAQIMSKNLSATQHDTAMCALAPMLRLEPAAIHMVRGTEVHVGASAEHEERLARDLGCEKCPETGAYSRWHLQALSSGVLLDFAHHGRLGQRPWTKATGPTTLAAQIGLAAAKAGARCPDVAIRAHYHQWADSFDNHPVRVVQTGCWQLSTAYVHRVAAGSLPEIGGLILTCEEGEYELRKVKFPWRREEPWRLSA